MVDGNKMFGVASHLILGEGRDSTPMTAIPAFSETDFWIYSITLCCS
jgi:hypothetical protein